jgi:general secretion pathway protein H
MKRVHSHLGFTLIEVVVVMFLLVIILSVVSVNLGGDDSATVRLEARRLALLLQTAQEEAILQGRVLAVVLKEDGYSFVQLDSEGEFQPLDDDVLRPRLLPPGVILATIEIEGVAQGEEPRLILLPTGEIIPFQLTFAQGQARWMVEGHFNGEIIPLPPETEDV